MFVQKILQIAQKFCNKMQMLIHNAKLLQNAP